MSSKKRNLILTIIVLGLILAVAAVLILITLNMQKKIETSDPTLTADQVVTGVIRKMNYTNLSPISAENISRYYEIPTDSISDSAMYISGKSGTEVEVTCFRLQSDTAREPLMHAVNEYLEDKGVSPQTAVSQVINAKVATHLPYIFVAVAQDSESAVKAFETVLNDSLKNEADTASQIK